MPLLLRGNRERARLIGFRSIVGRDESLGIGATVKQRDDPVTLSISATPPFKSAEDAEDAGRATADLLRTVAEVMGQPDPVISMVVKRLCDGCGTTAPSADLPDDWTTRSDDDFCPRCSLPSSSGVS